MINSSLTVTPYGKRSFTIILLENEKHHTTVDRIIETSANVNCVFSDLSYEFFLNHESSASIKDVQVYINDTFEPSTYSNGKILFPVRGTSDKRIFLDCYGFVELSFIVTMVDGEIQYLHSKYLPVLVRKGELNEAVKSMASYVYNHQENLLLNGEAKPRDIAGLKENGYKSLSAQIILAEEIATIYELNYGYFKANSRFHIEKCATVDRLERLQYVTPATLNYIVSHPEQLKPVNSTSGVRIKNRVYQPEKTLLMQNKNSYDIYENRVVVGFLKKMINEIVELRVHCADLIAQIPEEEEYSSDYIYSSYYMFLETKNMLKNALEQLSLLYNKFTKLFGIYSNALKVTPENLVNTPHPTAVFLSVPQYNKIFVRIQQWFSFGIYDFSKENFMLSFIKISSLYENYLLARFINFFKDYGFTLNDSKRCLYPVSKKWKYKHSEYI